MRPRRSPQLVYDHLARLSDDRGLFEHALLSEPRPEHGYCVDDVARGLVVVCREQHRTPTLVRLERLYLAFVIAAVEESGRCHNRMDVDGVWSDDAACDDWWGRALWGLGEAVVRGGTEGIRARALVTFRIAAQQRSPHVRAMAYAALGAAQVLQVRPTELTAQRLLTDAVGAIPAGSTREWPWPEPRLRYANGTVAQALVVAGEALHDPQALERGLALLRFLLRVETRDGHLSVTAVGGRGPEDVGPGFDQQPIEVAALADACASAYSATHDPGWLIGIRLAWNWFLGNNDGSAVMVDAETGAGYDGLHADGPNLNQGAESTLAMLSVAQHARRVDGLR